MTEVVMEFFLNVAQLLITSRTSKTKITRGGHHMHACFHVVEYNYFGGL